MRFAFCASCALLLFGCTDVSLSERVEAVADGVVKELGSFKVQARLTGSSCGPEVPNPEESAGFEVRLTQRGNELSWKTGLSGFEGTIDTGAGDFSVGSETALEVTPEGDGDSECVLLRKNQASGNIERAEDQVEGFDGDLSFGFTIPDGIDCSALQEIGAGIERFPCEMKYALQGIKRRLEE